MKPVYVFLTTGFEEIEALGTVDVLRRAELEVKTVSLTAGKLVLGAHQVAVMADLLFEEVDCAQAQMLVLPGGTTKFNEHAAMKQQLLAFAQQGGKVAAICASPMVLGSLGLLKGKSATCYPGFEKHLDGATLKTSEAVVVDGNLTTGRGPGLTLEFALNLVEQLAGRQRRDAVARGLLLLA
ncbi:MAG: DJ-1/PfpI family protein [Burkholderiaceae bacterium]|nr:DJ-1/PfpI family protein [Burkholderiaceae bacterium]